MTSSHSRYVSLAVSEIVALNMELDAHRKRVASSKEETIDFLERVGLLMASGGAKVAGGLA